MNTLTVGKKFVSQHKDWDLERLIPHTHLSAGGAGDKSGTAGQAPAISTDQGQQDTDTSHQH
ncbi:hypothetical protein E2C01_016826 [Portunus trituberculatus]|uniref:Uncharacterized protein n=1 Tax=Portunus trituberculatus TaxID=210409 RepID=A0A5B7DRZ2_PORTR|nr:hypothetical protein [Portunus trituberculatus]